MDTSAPWRALDAPESGKAEEPAARSGRTAFVAMVVVAVVLAVAALAVAAVIEMSPNGRVEVVAGPAGSGPVTSGPPAQMLVVQVAGAVVRPGVFSLPAGSRVADAIRAAGGYAPDVDPRQAETKLNLAAKLQDAQLISVPRLGDSSGTTSGTAPPAAVGNGSLNLNTATAEQLDSLPGIGPATAAKIIASRGEKPFATVDDLVSRKLVTAATLAKFRDQVTVG